MGGDPTAAHPVATGSGTPEVSRAANRVVSELERMIVTGELLPGQPIRQELMAERLGVSRLPVREGLRQLTSEGLVKHQHNVGYTVARLDQSEFDQIYLMRAALEREVLAVLPRFDDAALDEISRLRDLVEDAADTADILEMRLRNQEFHFAVFERSPLSLVVAELRRLWNLAMPYHAAYLYDAEVRARVCAEHDDMVDALAAGDNELLIELMNVHRKGGETSTGVMLGKNPPDSAHRRPDRSRTR
ncbi:GntR family transcriptional regulator [Gordonia sp. zg691]|uniref:GntR family transcriptional regulator n=1 Tax=Gordonia jinghuaiqii TaxID=2758710 RepID=A0A7D7R3I6_9ACTN|nr:GntR family transcriptional regulator [Gordonia jinghuaiqii]MBD0861741.1 GntR family transcriptional regulator [Gordonia jinghuaiqii]MCR5977633.1 GntR family transcriptional regulator [Gordonia jinghuaiqii]QMT02307.1 GntR family transcriptional regulator [Gordonia jinghuaiqii]